MPRVSCVLALFMLVQTPASAQIGYLWSMEELQRSSDVVAVATPTSTRDTGVRTELTNLQPPLPVIELTTKFTVLSVLKGTMAGPTLQLRHYRLDDARIGGGCLNCGGLIQFTPEAPVTRTCRAGDVSPQLPSRCDYLLFLMRDGAGGFTPTSGSVFPGSSIFLLRRAG